MYKWLECEIFCVFKFEETRRNKISKKAGLFLSVLALLKSVDRSCCVTLPCERSPQSERSLGEMFISPADKQPFTAGGRERNDADRCAWRRNMPGARPNPRKCLESNRVCRLLSQDQTDWSWIQSRHPARNFSLSLSRCLTLPLFPLSFNLSVLYWREKYLTVILFKEFRRQHTKDRDIKKKLQWKIMLRSEKS